MTEIKRVEFINLYTPSAKSTTLHAGYTRQRGEMIDKRMAALGLTHYPAMRNIPGGVRLCKEWLHFPGAMCFPILHHNITTPCGDIIEVVGEYDLASWPLADDEVHATTMMLMHKMVKGCFFERKVEGPDKGSVVDVLELLGNLYYGRARTIQGSIILGYNPHLRSDYMDHETTLIFERSHVDTLTCDADTIIKLLETYPR